MDTSKALLVIDVQQALFEKSTPIYKAGELLQNIRTLIEQAHRSGTPVFFIQHANNSFLAQGSEGWQLHPQLQVTKADTLIHKRHGNAFEQTPLHQELKARGINTVVVTGLVTHGCVRATCLGGQELGYQVILVSDGHSNYHKKAASVIEEWNQKLSETGVDLRLTQEMTF
ncbi:MAG: cysteine hydrolase [Anaerolineae bacterium]|nr:cysteine hydrolase [Anaerolineae bacterium]